MAATCRPTEKPRPKLLVTGSSGLLGHAICASAQSQWSVLALYRSNKPKVAGVRPIQVDLTNRSELTRLFRELAPAAVIHTAAAAQVGACEAHPDQTETINVAVPAWLAHLSAESGSDYLFTSTDLVFDGRQAPYDESGQVNPVCVYGEQKAQAEQAVLRRNPRALVCRLPLMFGLAPYAVFNFTMQMLKAFYQGQVVKLLTDEYRTPVDNLSAAQGVLHLIGQASGLLHLGGPTRISRYDLGRLMATFMGKSADVIRPVTIEKLGLDVARSPDCALDSRKAYQLGYNPLPIDTAVKTIVDEFNLIASA